LDNDNPCKTLAAAILDAESSGQTTVAITIKGEHEDLNLTIRSGLFVHFHSPNNSQSMNSSLLLFFFEICVYDVL
jgi:hypothetical protein